MEHKVMFPVAVLKSGGGVLREPASLPVLLKILEWVWKEHPEIRWVWLVVSAFGKTTSRLETIWRTFQTQPSRAIQQWDELAEWILAFAPDDACRQEVERILRQYRNLWMDGSSVTPFLTAGERVSAVIVESFLRNAGISPAIQYVSAFSGIRVLPTVDLIHDWSRGWLRKTLISCMAESPRGILITEGFVGRHHEMVTRPWTLSREGSDYTAAFLATSIHAPLLVFWKQTGKIRAGNPESSEGYEEIPVSMAWKGAITGLKFLHPRTLQEIQQLFRYRKNGEPIRVEIRDPEAPGTPGTRIIPDPASATPRIPLQVSGGWILPDPPHPFIGESFLNRRSGKIC